MMMPVPWTRSSAVAWFLACVFVLFCVAISAYLQRVVSQDSGCLWMPSRRSSVPSVVYCHT